MNYEERLQELNKELNQAKDTKNRATWRLEELKKEQALLEEKIRGLGLEPDELETQINTLENEIEKLLEEADSLLPRNLENNE